MKPFLERLAARRKFGIRPTLDTMQALCEALGHPEQSFAVIHIAGTNGKGSVAALCEAALRIMGFPVARYTSPHLVHVNERFFVHGAPVSDAALDEALNRVEAVAAEHHLEPTFFEVLTACAWLVFQSAGAKIVVCEVGMGGRWDATNVIEAPLLSIITHVALDHCAILGDTIEKVAYEKAGIIKPGRPVIMGAMDARAKAVIAQVAAEQRAPLYDASSEISVSVHRRTLQGQTLKCTSQQMDYPPALTRLSGTYQTENAATVLCALEHLSECGIDVPAKAFVEAMRTVQWPGRCQLIANDPPTFLDGGHNPDALAALCASLKSMHVRRRVALVCGFCADKAVADAIKEILPLVSAVWTVPIANDRSLSPEELATLVRGLGQRSVVAMDSVEAGLDAATMWAQENQGTVVICGSLFLVGEVLLLRGEDEGDALDPSEGLRAY